MPIKRLQTQVQEEFPSLGKIVKGAPKPNDRQPGKDLEYFRFVNKENPEIEKAFYQIYGAQPQKLDVFLPFATPDENFECWQEQWKAGGMVHRCDGETCVLHRITTGANAGKMSQEPVPCPGGCKEVGRMSLVMLPLIEATNRAGYVTLETHSINDIVSLTAGLRKAYSEAGGASNPNGLKGIEFTVRRVPEQISTPRSDKDRVSRVRRTKWMLKIEPSERWVRAQIESMRRSAFAYFDAPQEALAIDAPVDEVEVEYVTDDVVDAEPVEAEIVEEQDELDAFLGREPEEDGDSAQQIPAHWYGNGTGRTREQVESALLEALGKRGIDSLELFVDEAGIEDLSQYKGTAYSLIKIIDRKQAQRARVTA